MKKVLLCIFFLYLTPPIIVLAQDFNLHENGITIVCEGATIGSTGVVNGITYTAVDKNTLRNTLFTTGDVTKVCTSNVTSLFTLPETFNQDISSWDVSNVTSMEALFRKNSAFDHDISNWDVSSVKQMRDMFSGSTFNGDISQWDVSNVTFMLSMFENATLFNQDIGSWDVGKVTQMANMFKGALAFNQDIGAWDLSNVRSTQYMFAGAAEFNQDLNNWNLTQVDYMDGMFNGATSFNGKIDSWNVSGVSRMIGMFGGASNFNQDISDWDVKRAELMDDMFNGAVSFNQDIGTWNVSSATTMYRMFYGATSFNQDIGDWNVINVSNMRSMFQGANSFSGDLRLWCVKNISFVPINFAIGSQLSEDMYPNWGSCPVRLGSIKIIAPEDSSIVEITNPVFTWDEVTGANEYTLQIDSLRSFLTLHIDTISTINSLIINDDLLNNKKYYWRLIARSELETDTSSIYSFDTKIKEPDELLKFLPENYSLNMSLNPEFKWEANNESDNYQFQLSIDSTFNNVQFDSSGILGESIILKDKLDYLTTYYWRVRGSNVAGYGKWGEIWTFETIIEKPLPPTLIYPLYNESDVDTTVEILWSRSSRAKSYILDISQDSTFNNVDHEILTTDTLYQFTLTNNLLPNTKYYIRLKSINNGGESEWIYNQITTRESSNKTLLTGLVTNDILLTPSNNPYYIRDTLTVLNSSFKVEGGVEIIFEENSAIRLLNNSMIQVGNINDDNEVLIRGVSKNKNPFIIFENNSKASNYGDLNLGSYFVNVIFNEIQTIQNVGIISIPFAGSLFFSNCTFNKTSSLYYRWGGFTAAGPRVNFNINNSTISNIVAPFIISFAGGNYNLENVDIRNNNHLIIVATMTHSFYGNNILFEDNTRLLFTSNPNNRYGAEFILRNSLIKNNNEIVFFNGGKLELDNNIFVNNHVNEKITWGISIGTSFDYNFRDMVNSLFPSFGTNTIIKNNKFIENSGYRLISRLSILENNVFHNNLNTSIYHRDYGNNIVELNSNRFQYNKNENPLLRGSFKGNYNSFIDNEGLSVYYDYSDNLQNFDLSNNFWNVKDSLNAKLLIHDFYDDNTFSTPIALLNPVLDFIPYKNNLDPNIISTTQIYNNDNLPVQNNILNLNKNYKIKIEAEDISHNTLDFINISIINESSNKISNIIASEVINSSNEYSAEFRLDTISNNLSQVIVSKGDRISITPYGSNTTLTYFVEVAPIKPNSISLVSPNDYSNDISINPMLIWNNEINVDSFYVEFSLDNFETIEYSKSTIDTSLIISDLNNNTIYYWRVRGSNSEGYGEWSDVWQFKTSPFFIDNDGKIYCYGSTVGSTGLINEETYEVVDRDLLIQRRNEGADLSKTCVSNVSNMTGLFANTTFNQPIGNWDVSNVTDMSGMFQNNATFNQDLSKWNVDSVKTMTSMFQNSSFDKNIGDWNVSSVERMQKMFSGTDFNQPIGTWDVSSVIGMDEMFENSSFNQDISSWNVSSVGRMTNMFKGSDFNQPIGNWDVSNVYNMQGMFQKTSFNQDIGAWDVSKVTTMFGMFSENSSFNHDISSWDVSNVEAMVAMFFQNTAFNQDLGSWDVSNVKNMSSMFYLSGFNQDISNWDVSNVASMSNMFYGSPFNQNISNWCVILINSEPTNFSTDSPLALENKPMWGSCPAETPSQITLLSPSNNSSNVESRPYFSWNIDSLATKYELQLFNNQSIIIQDTLTDSTSLTLPFNLDLSSTYNWQVRGINDDKGLNGEWSELWSFTTKKVLLSAPTLSSPYNNQSNVGTMTEFYWNEVDSALFYHLQVSNDEQFSSIAFELTNITINSFLITTPLTENSIYFWRVKSISDDTLRNSDWSEMFSFTTGVRTSTEDELLPQEYTLSQNYPNPFNPSTQIEYALPEATQVTLEVFNSVGQKVMELVNGQKSAGYHTATFDASGLSSGVYLYKLTTPSFTQTKKMLLIK